MDFQVSAALLEEKPSPLDSQCKRPSIKGFEMALRVAIAAFERGEPSGIRPIDRNELIQAARKERE